MSNNKQQTAESECTCIKHDPYCCQIHGSCPICVEPETPEDVVLGYKTSLVAQMLDSNTKQETIKEAAEILYDDNLFDYGKYRDGFIEGAKWQKQTIEEAAERILSKEGIKQHPSGLETYLKGNVISAMVEMFKWQGEKMYSEEEVLELLHDRMIYTLGSDYQRTTTTEWFEQFKKSNK